MADPLAATFRKPFPAQVAAFRLRLQELVPTAQWDDIWQESHDRAFMVAGATKADLLADLAAAVDKAISEGTGYDAFKRDFRAVVERHGWHGWTGEGSKKGEEWRMRVIYRTNMRTSYMAGRHAQLVDGNYRFWIYRHSGAAHPRLDHLSWDGLVLRPDHPFWALHFPPNGWGCGCEVEGARSERGAIRMGGDPSKALPGGWNSIDPKTGAPPGIGRGWAYAPGGTTADAIRNFGEKTVHWPHQLAKAFMEDLPEGVKDGFARGYRMQPSTALETRLYAERALGERNGAEIADTVIVQPFRTLGMLTREQVRQVERATGRDATGFDFVLDPFGIRHAMRQHGSGAETARGQLPLAVTDFALLPRVLDDPDAFAPAGTNDLGLPLVRFEKTLAGRTLVAVFELRGRKRRMLALQSMWVKGGSGRPSA